MVIISSILLKKMRTSKQKNKHEVELLYRPPKDWRNKIKKAPKIWSFQPGAQDWNRSNPGYQLFIAGVCQICVVKSERAKRCAGSS
jgi:hypothetical protein